FFISIMILMFFFFFKQKTAYEIASLATTPPRYTRTSTRSELSRVRQVFQLGAILVLCGRAAPAADHPQDALHLTLKQSVTSGRGRARWVSRAPAVIPPAADPRSVGGTLRIIGLYQDVTVPLPAGNWSSPS